MWGKGRTWKDDNGDKTYDHKPLTILYLFVFFMVRRRSDNPRTCNDTTKVPFGIGIWNLRIHLDAASGTCIL